MGNNADAQEKLKKRERKMHDVVMTGMATVVQGVEDKKSVFQDFFVNFASNCDQGG
ncbi:hypothetical protein INT08_07275 [Prosthecochloris sp. N3]|uniref:Uncharacterized protein n=1 Tax=Prosthecochloris ethylica TaxID=2743976 RepID=A0ABR9XT11_9CHLB|nr:hypothetical protein [Prosthecochloris ethylica]MBF0586676.1 hypothetical protein [Prosthecochloris ethylica]MBF0636970.1 hypothetical protein [Prosthecochloris ethylica]NUK47841.1 hypothetical protein [Prosthecochloris ethylica]